MIIKVKAKLEFEVEYPLNLDFYETDKAADAITSDKKTFTRDPGLLLSLFEGEGKTTVTIEQMNDEKTKL